MEFIDDKKPEFSKLLINLQEIIGIFIIQNLLKFLCLFLSFYKHLLIFLGIYYSFFLKAGIIYP